MSDRAPPRRRRHGPALRFPWPTWTGNEGANPFGAVLSSDGRRVPLAIAALVTGALYAGVVVIALTARPPAPTPIRREIPVVDALPPPPVPPPPPARAAETPRQPLPHPRRVVPPAPAQAAQVVTQAAPDAPADFTDFAIATGHADAFAGGYTSSKGTSATAVTSAFAKVPPHPGPAAPPSQARPAQPLRRDWSCGWPDAAVQSDLRDTRVAVRVEVSPDGDATEAHVEGQALPGFAAAAKRCALDEQYRPALDSEGHRTKGQTDLLVVHFLR